MSQFQSTFSTAILIASLSAGCATEKNAESPVDGTSISMDWEKGETFYVATAYRRTNVKTAELPVDFEAAFDGTAIPQFGENWTQDVIWTYQVVEADMTPAEDDELYRFAETNSGVASLAVIKASLDTGLNADEGLLEADPVIYMVFREDRDRMVGLISFVNVDGERIETAYSASELERSWSTLSQSMLTKAPTYLAPFSARWGNAERTLENGSVVTSVKVDDSTTDIFYSDEMGSGTVVSRYEAGQPWPTWTTTANVDARLISAADVDALRFDNADFAPLPDNENFDYREALQTAIDIDSALSLDLERAATGTIADSVADEYKPWAGSWWPLKKGELVFGYDGRDTYSDEIREKVDPIKKDMDELSAKIREPGDDDDVDAMKEEYREKQSELVDIIKEFYGGLLTDLDGGKISYEDGKLVHSEDEWEYDLNELSPMDKYALVQYDAGNTYPNPFFISGWEILNSYNPGGDSWWGHCNGWAAAAILTNEPREEVTVDLGDEEVSFTTADVKGLLTESHYSTYSQFYGERYNGEDDDVTDLSPKAFHQILTFFIGQQGVPMVFDTTATEAVWNFPAYAYELSVSETTEEGLADLVNVNTASADKMAALPGFGDATAARVVEYRFINGPFQDINELIEIEGIGEARFMEFKELVTVDAFQRSFSINANVTLTTDGVGETHVDGEGNEPRNFKDSWSYTLHTDADGLVVGGTWTTDTNHPDFAWIPYHNTSRRENGSSENPFLSYGSLLDVIGEDIERK